MKLGCSLLTKLIPSFELFLLGEGEKKIEEKVYSGMVYPEPN
jgi:hypothetical protein